MKKADELPEGAEIKIVVGEDGNTVISVVGVKGGGCTEFTRPFREATGEVVASRHTTEYREEEETSENSHRVRR